MTLLGERRQFVQMMLGNRSDITGGSPPQYPTRVDNWLWQSYVNIGMSFSFEQAETTVTDSLDPTEDSIDFPSDVRAIKAITAYRADGTMLKIDIKSIQYLRQYNPQSKGAPSICAFFGSKIHFRPVADDTYSLVIDYWQKPVLIVGDGNNETIAGDIGRTELQVPDDWLEIVDYGAALRGHIALMERDKAQEIQQLLFGFTVPTTGRQVPGLIAQAINRRQAQAPTADYGIAPRQSQRSYTNV